MRNKSFVFAITLTLVFSGMVTVFVGNTSLNGENYYRSTEVMQTEYNLTIYIEGEGSTVPEEGTHTYVEGEEVTVEAIPDEGWYFEEWTGDYEGMEEEISITMDEDKSITAWFVEIVEYELTINAEEGGTTDPAPGTYMYEEGEEVTVEAIPDEGYEFVEWTGDDDTGPTITVTMDEDMEITATFEEVVVDEPYFEVEITHYDDEVEEGETVTVGFTVMSTGGSEGTQDIVFNVDGTEEDSVEVTLDVGEEDSGEFEWEAEEEGEYDLEVASYDDSDSVTLTVEALTVEEDEIDMMMITGIILFIIIILTIIGYMMKRGSEKPRPTIEEDKEFQPPQEQPSHPSPPPSQETQDVGEHESTAKSDLEAMDRERKDRIRDELESLKEEEDMIDTRDVERALEENNLDRAEEELEVLKTKYSEYEETIQRLKELDERKSQLAEQLAEEKIDRETYNDAAQNIDNKKADLEERLNQLRKEVIHEDYEKPF